MSNITSYETDKELDKALAELLEENEYPDLEHIKLAACFSVISKEDDTSMEPLPTKGDQVALKKVPPAFRVFMKTEPELLIIVDKHFWNECDAKTKAANLDSFLSRIQVEAKDDGGWKATIKPWDIQVSLANVKKYGAYNSKLLLFSDVLTKPARIGMEMVAAHIKPQKATDKPVEAAKPTEKRGKAPVRKEEPPAAMPEDDEEEKPRVRSADEELGHTRSKMTPVKSRVSPLKGTKVSDDDEPVRPARKVPDDSEKNGADDDEPPVPDGD